MHDDQRAGEFWRQALGYVRRPQRFEGDDWIVLEPRPGEPGVAIAMDISESPAREFPRVHFDLDAGERDLGKATGSAWRGVAGRRRPSSTAL
ncbi:VOC family protein [Streptomyces sp. NPDC050619]|uniref:VOC family protein n=1 Tax=Streptomyces sp. NPDC050619 TaxID=3157214 RepID=UPI00344028A6